MPIFVFPEVRGGSFLRGMKRCGHLKKGEGKLSRPEPQRSTAWGHGLTMYVLGSLLRLWFEVISLICFPLPGVSVVVSHLFSTSAYTFKNQRGFLLFLFCESIGKVSIVQVLTVSPIQHAHGSDFRVFVPFLQTQDNLVYEAKSVFCTSSL